MQIFLLKIAGIFFVGLAGLGVVLPLLPTTPFLLVATACFAKSSPRFHQKLLDNKVFGPLITNWRETRSIPKKAKVIALLSIILTMIYSSYFIENTYVKISFILFMMFPIIFIARLPLSELKLNSQHNAK
ncbi:YbaN family protein [Thalassotalea agariperforans]